jgi:hypothetical protein
MDSYWMRFNHTRAMSRPKAPEMPCFSACIPHFVVRTQYETRNLVRSKMPSMKITTGIVVDGKVVVEGESLAEGSTVTVLLRDNEEAFELTPAEEEELLDSIAQIEGGEFVSGEQLLERLRRFG